MELVVFFVLFDWEDHAVGTKDGNGHWSCCIATCRGPADFFHVFCGCHAWFDGCLVVWLPCWKADWLVGWFDLIGVPFWVGRKGGHLPFSPNGQPGKSCPPCLNCPTLWAFAFGLGDGKRRISSVGPSHPGSWVVDISTDHVRWIWVKITTPPKKCLELYFKWPMDFFFCGSLVGLDRSLKPAADDAGTCNDSVSARLSNQAWCCRGAQRSFEWRTPQW